MCDPLTDVERAMLQINGSLERRLFVIAGPSGVGKNTIIKELLANHPHVMDRVRTYTTRPQRIDEVEGEQYFFVSEERFIEMAKEGLLLEADEKNPRGEDVYGTDHCYSMPKEVFENVSPEAHLVVAEVDTVGAERLRKLFKNCVTIFITAPPDVLIRRIENRKDKTLSDADLEQRMSMAKKHIKAASDFHYIVYNVSNQLTQAVLALENIVHAERMRVPSGFKLEDVLPPDTFDLLKHKNGNE